MQRRSGDKVDLLVEEGRREAVGDGLDERAAALAAVQFADRLRHAADQLGQESAEMARRHGASWREIGVAVGGITPQGAEHRFSAAAKARRAKASKVSWADKERRVN
jgi:prolyl-tRNA editing enzyme YbaK/EbsC (Cys-tRNA(Pro) deacylase)